MIVSLELFLIDNLVMDLLILQLGCVFCGTRFRLLRALPFAAIGAGYAALSVSLLPFLSRLLPKLLLGAAMAIPLCLGGRSFLRALVSLYLAAFLAGGTVFALTVLFSGSPGNRALIATTPVRTVLCSVLVVLLLPRCIRELILLCRARERFVRIRVQLTDRVLQLEALVDSGNLLTDPVSGKPVVLVQPNLLPLGGRPVPFCTVNGNGVVFAQATVRLEADFSGWMELDAMIAEAPETIEGADAILPDMLLEAKRRENHVPKNAETTDAVVLESADQEKKCCLLHFLRRNASGAFSARGGATVDRKAQGRRSDGKEHADRA